MPFKGSASMSLFAYRLGIEEEYFVIDRKSLGVRLSMPKKFFRSCKRHLKEHVTNEMLQSQIEVMTSPCETMDEARDQIRYLRRVVASEAAGHNLGIMAASTHPTALWPEQKLTEKDRYGEITKDAQITGLRSLLCGMHVHVEVPDPARRVELMVRAIPFLPLLLALSTSSPFWQGRRTGLAGYRQAAHEEMPRNGLPELFRTEAEYGSYVNGLIEAGIIPDASHIWWDIRPSASHPTVELRITDVCTRIEDAISIATVYRCLIKHLFENKDINAHLDAVDRAFAEENKWRAERFGTKASFVKRGLNTAQTIDAAVANLLVMLARDAEALGCSRELQHAKTIVQEGSSANAQIHIYAEARLAGKSKTRALKGVVAWLMKTTALLNEEESA
jgi:glutamate---cysteine ligase / carboxylate-amine ligase